MSRVHSSPATLGRVIARLPRVMAHRGGAAHAPENTLAAFREARRRGARWVEFDVALSADGVPVVCHDDGLERTTNLTGLVRERSYAELQAGDAGSWFSPSFEGESIPGLAAVLGECARLGLGANIEIKFSDDPEAVTRRVVDTIRASPMADGRNLLISSFDVRVLFALQSLETIYPTGLLYRRYPPVTMDFGDCGPEEWMVHAQGLEAQVLGMHDEEGSLDLDVVRRVAARMPNVLVFTVNDLSRARALIAAGATGVFSDDLDALGPLL